jgi:alpha-tubulin suppressor-like RCC1 family protein
MLAVNEIITKINNLLSSGSLTQLQVAQLSAAVKSIENYGVSAVATAADLPNVVTNVGRFFYIASSGTYTLSNGIEWDIQNIIVKAPVNLFAWGNNQDGRLGDNTITNKSSPVSVVGGFTDWIFVDGNGDHSLGIRANGTAWGWGDAANGRLGNLSSVDRSSPVLVVGGFTDWTQVSAGSQFSLGLRANGTAWAWGAGATGQLGDNTNGAKSSPVSVVGGFTDWIQVSAIGSGSIGLRANGTAWAWGLGYRGALGNNSTLSVSSPVSVVGGFTDWIQVNSGGQHRLALRANGTAWSWGVDAAGQLGDNNTVDRSSPVSVVGGFTDWVQVDGGWAHSLGVRENGTAWAWGNNQLGRLGDGTVANKSSPVSVVGGFTDWTQVSAGTYHSLGLRANGTAWAWGNAALGRVGDNTTVAKSSPVSVVGGYTDWIQVSASTDSGSGHSLGLRG